MEASKIQQEKESYKAVVVLWMATEQQRLRRNEWGFPDFARK